MNSAEVTVLVRRAAAGQQTAWEALVDEYSHLVWSVVRGFRLGEAQAADAAQTTWLRLVEHLTDIRDPERLPGWLRTTARRTCLAIIRESGREQLTEHVDDLSASIGRYRDDEDGGPEARVLRQDRQALVRQALAGLTERQRTLLALLVASPPMSYSEIGARLDMPVGSIGPTRARILARLREALETADLHDLALA
jgi:RNA polymerase sigma factor (sigma-70 family)